MGRTGRRDDGEPRSNLLRIMLRSSCWVQMTGCEYSTITRSFSTSAWHSESLEVVHGHGRRAGATRRLDQSDGNVLMDIIRLGTQAERDRELAVAGPQPDGRAGVHDEIDVPVEEYFELGPVGAAGDAVVE